MIDIKRLDQIKRRAEQGDPVVGVGDTITNGELLELIERIAENTRLKAPVSDEEGMQALDSFWPLATEGTRSFVYMTGALRQFLASRATRTPPPRADK